MPTFPFELVAPEKLVYSGEVESMIVPGTEGEFTVLKYHAPLVSSLKPGVIVIEERAAARVRLYVRGGLYERCGIANTVCEKSIRPSDGTAVPNSTRK